MEDLGSILGKSGEGTFSLRYRVVAGALRPGVKWPRHEALSRDEVKISWSYTFTPTYVFMTWYLVLHSYNFKQFGSKSNSEH
jgi:hypothetical protein